MAIAAADPSLLESIASAGFKKEHVNWAHQELLKQGFICYGRLRPDGTIADNLSYYRGDKEVFFLSNPYYEWSTSPIYYPDVGDAQKLLDSFKIRNRYSGCNTTIRIIGTYSAMAVCAGIGYLIGNAIDSLRGISEQEISLVELTGMSVGFVGGIIGGVKFVLEQQPLALFSPKYREALETIMEAERSSGKVTGILALRQALYPDRAA